MGSSFRLIVTCEHGGNRVPVRFRRLFSGRESLLAGHRGYDPGAIDLAREVARSLRGRIVTSTVSRLIVDLNRSPGNRRRFSEITGRLGREEKRVIMRHYYFPYRDDVEKAVASAVRSVRPVVHLSVHSFSPVIDGIERRADVGLLYDPARTGEREFCRTWKEHLAVLLPGLRIRFNYPYRGSSDGITTCLRRNYSGERYIGIELEVNQKFPRRGGREWSRIRKSLIRSLRETMVMNCPKTG